MPRPHILILGHGEHGKDTLATALEEHAGMISRASSWHVAEMIAPVLGYPSAQAAFDDRRNRRAEWKQFIRDYTMDDPTRLMRELYEQSDIYVGLRDRTEFDAGVREGIFDLIIYVTRGSWDPKNNPADPPDNGIWWPYDSGDRTLDMSMDDADVVLYNDSTLARFERRCTRFAKYLGALNWPFFKPATPTV